MAVKTKHAPASPGVSKSSPVKPAKAVAAKTKFAGPPVLRFTAVLERVATKPSGGAGAVIEVPSAVAKKLAGVESAEGTINGHPFRAALARVEGGGCSFRVNAAMLRGAAAGPGATVSLALLGYEGELVVASDFLKALEASPEARALWEDMNDTARRDYVRWIDGTGNAETRARRIRRTVEQLAEGKRRPCCFNAYEYPLSYIDPDWLKKFQARAAGKEI